MSYLRKRTFQIVLLFAIIWLTLDFTQFCQRALIASEQAATPSNMQAVVVLTGGGARIATAAQIADANGLPLFISGVHRDAKAEEVALAAGVDKAFFDCCVTLGYNAATTAQNGDEVAAWAREENYNRFLVVTSSYHMERALMELRRAMPEAQLSGYSVVSPTIDPGNWWRDARSAKRMLLEWFKWRVVSIRESLS